MYLRRRRRRLYPTLLEPIWNHFERDQTACTNGGSETPEERATGPVPSSAWNCRRCAQAVAGRTDARSYFTARLFLHTQTRGGSDVTYRFLAICSICSRLFFFFVFFPPHCTARLNPCENSAPMSRFAGVKVSAAHESSAQQKCRT